MKLPRVKIQVRDLNFYYGKIPCPEGAINLDIAKNQVTAFYRAIHVAAVNQRYCGTFNKMYSLYPGQRGKVKFCWMATIFSPTPGYRAAARKSEWYFQKPTPFPDVYDNIAFGVRLFGFVSRRYGRARAVGVDQSRIMERNQKINCTRAFSLSGGRQRAAVHCA